MALYAAGVFDADTGLRLMQIRSELMADAGGGAMTAVMGFDRDELENLVDATEGVVIANDNSAAQVVLSGTPAAVAEVSATLRCKRAVPLAVSGAFHSPWMAGPAAAFADALESVPFADAAIPVLSNTDPTPATSGAILKERLRPDAASGMPVFPPATGATATPSTTLAAPTSFWRPGAGIATRCGSMSSACISPCRRCSDTTTSRPFSGRGADAAIRAPGSRRWPWNGRAT